MSGRKPLTLVVVGMLLAAGGCSGSASVLVDGEARVEVHLTDAPAELIGAAEVSISRVYLIADDGERVDLLAPDEDPPSYDLLELRDGVEALLAESSVPAGRYVQLRLVVDEATVVQADIEATNGVIHVIDSVILPAD